MFDMVLSPQIQPEIATNSLLKIEVMANSAGYGVYTNNNYINMPDENISATLTSPTLSSSTSSFPCPNAAAATNRFTFATPTQGSVVSHVAQQYTNTASTTMSNVVTRTVPGLGATWQHSPPNVAHTRLGMNITWQNSGPHISHIQCGVDPVVSQQLSVPQDMPWMQDAQSLSKDEVSVFSAMPLQPQFCCEKRGPKRRLGIRDGDNGCSPTGSKQFISEEMMATRMKGLSIDSSMCTNPSFIMHGDCHHLAAHMPRPSSQSWQRMKEIEERLEDEDEEEDGSVFSTEGKQEPRLHMLTHDIAEAKDLLSTNTLLPKKILDDLIKPSMQVVLWKPPGDFIKNAVAEVVSSEEEDRNLLPEVETIRDQLPEDFECSTLPVSPILPQSIMMPDGLASKDNAAVQIDEAMDL